MAKPNPIVAALTHVPLFRNVTSRQMGELARVAKEREYDAGAVVLKKGDTGLGLYVILHGEVEVRRGRNTLARFGPGQFFGEMTLLTQEPRSADVVAVTSARCLVLSSWEFWGWATDKPDLLRGMLTEMARRLRLTDQALSE